MKPNRFLLSILLGCWVMAPCFTNLAAELKVFVLDGKHLSATREKLRGGDASLKPALEALVVEADELLKARPVSVMDKKVTPPSGDKHDYMSQAPYFWPNPATSNGLPYIRRDGEGNPEIGKISDHGNILAMPEKALTLALAFFFTGEERYAEKASEFLRVWFLNPDTKMNPHFLFAQGIPGINTGRGIGLIESRGLVRVVDAVGLLSASKAWTREDQKGLEKWYSEFLKWMLESPYGKDEAAAKNNHGTYYDLQVVSFALFVGQRDLAIKTLETAKQKRIALQIEPNGEQPLETARTKGWGYSMGNLSGLVSLARVGESVGVDLWGYRTPDGRSILKALDFLLQFRDGKKPWPYQQISGGAGEGLEPLLRQAALRFPKLYREEALKPTGRRASNRDVLLYPPIP